MAFNTREQELVSLWRLFVRVSRGILTNTLPEDKRPSAGELGEIRKFLEREKVDLKFVSRELGPSSTRSHAHPEGFVAPFPKKAAGGGSAG